MADSRASTARTRVVALLPDGAVKASLLQGLSSDALTCVCVASPYEAAAEMILAPVRALVLEPRLLGPRHRRLLRIARELNVELLAVGAASSAGAAGELSSLRMLTPEEAMEALRALGRPEGEESPEFLAESAQASPAAGMPQYVSDAPAGLSDKRPARGLEADAQADRQAADPRSLLTVDELSALLGDRSRDAAVPEALSGEGPPVEPAEGDGPRVGAPSASGTPEREP